MTAIPTALAGSFVSRLANRPDGIRSRIRDRRRDLNPLAYENIINSLSLSLSLSLNVLHEVHLWRQLISPHFLPRNYATRAESQLQAPLLADSTWRGLAMGRHQIRTIACI